MVTDLQGYYDADNKEYILTDPAIQCIKVDLFGRTNLSVEAINRCKKQYKIYLKR